LDDLREKGFTLIELLIVIAIIRILAAIAIPNLLNAVQRAKQKRTMGDMRALALAIEPYNVDHSMLPTASCPSGQFTAPGPCARG
jgi:type II secretion system protein G